MSEARIGRPVALFGDISGGKYMVDAAMTLNGQYVQGASKVYLRGAIQSVNKKWDLSRWLGRIDTSSFARALPWTALCRRNCSCHYSAFDQRPHFVESIRKSAGVMLLLEPARPDASVK
jgi:hypothetical protein